MKNSKLLLILILWSVQGLAAALLPLGGGEGVAVRFNTTESIRNLRGSLEPDSLRFKNLIQQCKVRSPIDFVGSIVASDGQEWTMYQILLDIPRQPENAHLIAKCVERVENVIRMDVQNTNIWPGELSEVINLK